MSKMSAEELAAVKGSKTEAQYVVAVDAVKGAHGGQYPDDWYAKMVLSGECRRIGAQWGDDAKIGVVIDGDEVGRY